MKKIIYIKIVSLLVLAFTVTSCSDEFLEQTNPNSLSTGTFWQDMDDLNMGLIGAYKSFSSANNILLVDDLVRSDVAWGSGYQRPTNTNEYYLQTFNDASPVPNNIWAQNYKTIFGANQVIEATEKLLSDGTFTTAAEIEDATIILAQARFIRGYMYFLLHHSFNKGAVPILDFVPEKESDYFQSIRPAEVVRELLLADLKYASENLPNTWEDTHKGRVTAGAAVALIGQTYLYQNKFDLAAPYFKSVIEDFGYALTENIGSNFTSKDELNEESILEVVYSMDYKNELNQWDSRDVSNSAYNKKLTGGPGAWRGAVPANWLIVEYRNDPIDTTDPRNKVIDEDGERFRKFSLRTSYSIALADDDDLGYYGFEKTGQASPFNVYLTSYWRKHTNWDLGFGSEDLMSPGKVRSPANERLIRLGEIYLQYAECLIELGDVDEALKYINKIRRRAGVVLLGAVGSGEYPTNDHDNVTYTAETLMEHLRYKEYPLELSCEGDNNRNIDLRRWGVKKQRFQELAARRYDVLHHDVTMPDGKVVTRWSSIMIEVDPTDPEVEPDLNEFEEAAVNYSEENNAYWPIPNSEIISNPKLYE